MTSFLTTFWVREREERRSKSYWQRSKSMLFSCSSPWRPIAWPAVCPYFSVVLHLPPLALTETLAHAPALCPHMSCPSPPYLGQSSRANDVDGFRVAVKHAGLIQWDLTTRSPFSSPGEPPQSSGMGSLNHWRACQTQPLLQHNIPLPQGNNFPYSDSVIYSYPHLLGECNTHRHMVCSCKDEPQGRQSDWCAIYSLPPVEKVPIWKDKLLIFSVRSSSHCLRWRMSKPNPSLLIKFTQIHRGKTCFSCEYQEPCAFTWCFSFFDDRER